MICNNCKLILVELSPEEIGNHIVIIVVMYYWGGLGRAMGSDFWNRKF